MAQSELPRVGGIEGMEESLDISQRADVPKLRKGAIGLGGVLFLTVTGSAPISAMLFNTPIMVGYGQGVGAPAAFMFAAIVLVVFSVGYVAMTRKKTSAGGFYSYISHGLGRTLGIGTGYGAVVAYSVFEASLAGGFAYFANLKVNAFGVNIGWPWFALGMVVLISVLTFFDVRLSSTLLAIGLISEIAILVIFDIFMFSKGHAPWAALNPANAFKSFPASGKLAAGSVGIGLFFAFWSWVGFEMAPNYAEESREPKRIVPRALYISVIGLGVFYALTSWAPLFGYPTTHAAVAAAQGNAANFYLAPATQYAGHWVSSIMSYLIITGSFACGMAFHNTTARYMYSLGREGLLPKPLGRTHPKFKSPYIASVVQTVIAAFIIILFAVFTGTNDPSLPGLPAAVRADGGDGRDHHPVRAGPGLAGHPGLLRAAPPGRGALVEDPAGPGSGADIPGRRGLPAVRQHRLPGQRLLVREVVRPDRPGDRADRRRRGVLLQEVQARQVRAGRTPHQRRTVSPGPSAQPAGPAGWADGLGLALVDFPMPSYWK